MLFYLESIIKREKSGVVNNYLTGCIMNRILGGGTGCITGQLSHLVDFFQGIWDSYGLYFRINHN
jgi:hypothetical protein